MSRRKRVPDRALGAIGAICAMAIVAGACSADSGDVTVLAASSLTDVLPAALRDADVSTSLSFLGSSSLATQIEEGRPADVVITANSQTMDRIVATGRVDGQPTALVTNRLVFAVPSGNPAGIEDIRDLGDESLTIAACSPDVPCGALTATLAAAFNVEPAIDSLDPNVRAVLTRVVEGAVDLGVVYATDAAGADVDVIEIDRHGDFVTTYFLAKIEGADAASNRTASARTATDQVIAALTGPGTKAFLDAGFQAP